MAQKRQSIDFTSIAKLDAITWIAPLLLVCGLSCHLPWGTAYAAWQLVSTKKLFPLLYETLHPSFLRVSFKGGFRDTI
jgi:hypothetical protein